MTDKALLLAEALNELDDKYLEEAHPEARGISLRVAQRQRTVRQIAAVACLCLVGIGVAQLSPLRDASGTGEAAPMSPPPSVGQIFMDGNSETSNSPSSAAGLGTRVDGAHGSLYFADETDTTVTVILTLNEHVDTPLYVYFEGYNTVLAATEPGVGHEGRLQITVDGAICTGSLPTVAGKYEIVIDFSRVLTLDAPIGQRFAISGFPALCRQVSCGTVSGALTCGEGNGTGRWWQEGYHTVYTEDKAPFSEIDLTDGQFDTHDFDVMGYTFRIPLSHRPSKFPKRLCAALDDLTPTAVYACFTDGEGGVSVSEPLPTTTLEGKTFYDLDLTVQDLHAGQYITLLFVFPADTLKTDPLTQLYPIERMTVYLDGTDKAHRHRQQWLRQVNRPFDWHIMDT